MLLLKRAVINSKKDIEKGKAPKSINRYDIGKGKHEKPHVHFKDGNALNQDGT